MASEVYGRRQYQRRLTNKDNDESLKKNTYIHEGTGQLDKGATGYLDPRILSMMGVDNKSCKSKASKECFLRRGVSVNDEPAKQSFIASLAHLNSDTKKFTIKAMKEHMIEIMTIEHFVVMQNGNLVDMFHDADIDTEDDDNDTEENDNSKLWENIDKMSGDEGTAYYKKVKRSFINFKKFLNDDSVLIDHTYLWDFVCMPNVFDKNGLNLVILELEDEDNDMTNRINILCPTNHYATSVFDPSKKTAILLKNNINFEPIFQKKKKDELYLFDYVNPVLKTTLQKIKVMMSRGCTTSNGLPSYTFEQNIPYIKLHEVLNRLKDSQGNQVYVKNRNVLNYTGKIVGIIVSYNADSGIEEVKGEKQEMYTDEFFLPCRPSPIMYYDEHLELQITENIWLHEVVPRSYNATRKFLKIISESHGAIKSKPVVKIVNDSDEITGILTETDQYVPVNPTKMSEATPDELPINKHMNYIHLEKVSTTNTGSHDGSEVEHGNESYIAVITEAKLYTTFRTTVRVLLDYDDNQSHKTNIEQIVFSSDKYSVKLKKIIAILHSIMINHVKFVDNYEITNPSVIKPCVKIKEKSLLSECNIEIPKTNLFNGLDNKETYFGRIADELVRYYVLRNFILSNDVEEPIVLLPSVNALLNDDEMIVGVKKLDEMVAMFHLSH